MRSKTRDCKGKTDADASIENTGWTTKYHTGHPFWVSALPDHTAQQPRTQSKTETKPTSSLGSLSLPSAIRMAIAHQFLQWGLHLGWAQLVFNSFPVEHGVYTELLAQSYCLLLTDISDFCIMALDQIFSDCCSHRYPASLHWSGVEKDPAALRAMVLEPQRSKVLIYTC